MNAGTHIFARGLALALLLALGILVWLAVIRPAQAWKTNTFEALSVSQSDQLRLRESLARLKAEHERLSGDTPLEVIWTAQQLGEATARIQSEVSSLAASHGITLRSITPVKSREMPFTSSVGFRVEGEATLDKLTGFLVDLEFNSPALVVERAVLRRLNRPGRSAQQPGIFVQLNLIAPVILDEEET